MARAKKTVTLYLEPFQRRMITDRVSRKLLDIGRRRLTRMEVAKGIGDCWVSYRLPLDRIVEGDFVLYLTEAQGRQLQAGLGLAKIATTVHVSRQGLEKGYLSFG